jgi:hypothetical protein
LDRIRNVPPFSFFLSSGDNFNPGRDTSFLFPYYFFYFFDFFDLAVKFPHSVPGTCGMDAAVSIATRQWRIDAQGIGGV